MGQSHHSIYGRRKDTDTYACVFDKVHGGPMSRFKHEVYCFVLDRCHQTMKSLYLYHGYRRRVKAHVLEDTLTLEFYDEATAQEWDRVEEQLAKIHVDIPWLERSFCRAWSPSVCTSTTVRIFKRDRPA